MEFKKLLRKIWVISLVLVAFNVRADELAQAMNSPSKNATCSTNYNALKWYRASAEHNAVYREVFLLAENVIKQKVSSERLKPKQWGVILDIDDTTLDNSWWFYQHDIKNVPVTMKDFVTQIHSFATPGVKQFVQDIHDMGGYVNFVSNRPIVMQKITEENLRKEGIYFDQVLLDGPDSQTKMYGKNPRFLAVQNGRAPSILPSQKILAWFGDNIQDFPQLKQSDMIKKNANSDAYNSFGVSYFAVPNPMYGSWKDNQFN